MEQTNFSEDLKVSKFDSFSKEDFIKRQLLLEEELVRVVRENYELRQIHLSDEQLKLITGEQLGALNEALYGASSERYKKPENKKNPELPPKPRVKKPSDRYPNIPVREIPITLNPIPGCESCGNKMSDSGMTEDSEVLTVIPKKFEILKYKRQCKKASIPSGEHPQMDLWLR